MKLCLLFPQNLFDLIQTWQMQLGGFPGCTFSLWSSLGPHSSPPDLKGEMRVTSQLISALLSIYSHALPTFAVLLLLPDDLYHLNLNLKYDASPWHGLNPEYIIPVIFRVEQSEIPNISPHSDQL